jgi:hypothetical protein
MPLTRAQRNAAADQDASADAPAASSSQAPARRAFGAVDNQRKGSKRKAAAKKEPARDVRRPRPEPFKKPLPSPREPRPRKTLRRP